MSNLPVLCCTGSLEDWRIAICSQTLEKMWTCEPNLRTNFNKNVDSLDKNNDYQGCVQKIVSKYPTQGPEIVNLSTKPE